jgi:RNA polymerase primary sigma factor
VSALTKGHGEAELVETDLLIDEQTANPAAALFQTDELQQVMSLLDQLEKRAATVLRLRFGLSGEDPQTLLQLGERLGLTRERVRQIERDALARLAKMLQDGGESE